eukprot:scaffold92786_cov25-Cyclotella_meneghiniana.AAC.1
MANETLNARIEISRDDGYWPDCIVTCRDLEGREGCYELGKAIGNNSSVCRLELFGNENANDGISSTAYECVAAFYRGLQLTTSIDKLMIDVDLFPDSGELPPMNVLFGVNFKESLKELHLYCDEGRFISDNQSVMISSVLQDMALEELDMEDCRFDQLGLGFGFGRIISSCLKVKILLNITCNTVSKCASVADLLRNRTSILRELIIDLRGLTTTADEFLPTIMPSLIGNTALKKLCAYGHQGDYSFWKNWIQKTLCDTSSIEGVHINSNHTLETVTCKLDGLVNELTPLVEECPLIEDCLALNKQTYKEDVIRTKIARYYFIGDFDVSPFAKMAISLLPQVFVIIKCDATAHLSAIFRMLKSISELSNVTSRSVGQVWVDGQWTQSYKRQKVGF